MGSQSFCTLLARCRIRVPPQDRLAAEPGLLVPAFLSVASDTAEGKAHRIACGMPLTKRKQFKPGFPWKNYLQGHAHSTVLKPLGHPGKYSDVCSLKQNTKRSLGKGRFTTVHRCLHRP